VDKRLTILFYEYEHINDLENIKKYNIEKRRRIENLDRPNFNEPDFDTISPK